MARQQEDKSKREATFIHAEHIVYYKQVFQLKLQSKLRNT